jgi:ADP-L-glycero-D-manno-heptose 6-epimerase
MTHAKPFSESRILVTGGAGFIGSAIVWALNRAGAERVVISDFLGETEKWKNLAPLRFEDYFEADDLMELIADDALPAFDYVFHLGACSATTETDAEYLARNNFGYTKDLAWWALDRGARFVYASSAATYGDGSRGMADDAARLETLRPLNMYGYSKHLFDCWAKRADLLDRMVGLKFFNVFGPNEGHKGDMRSMVHKAFGQIAETGGIKLFKSHRPDFRDGEQLRDFLYVKDAAAIALHLAATPGAGGLYNIGSGAARTWIDLANAVFSAMGRPPSIGFVEMPEILRGKYQYHTCADIARLRSTGYEEPVTSLEAAVADYVGNYLVPGLHLGDEA